VLASADAAHFTLQKERVDLAGVAAAVAAEFGQLFQAEAVQLETQLEPAIVEGDPGRLRQIVGNLLANALKFTPRGGRVRIRLWQEADRAVIEVSDSGPGIPKDELGRVFERFFRGRAARAGGSGIGLTVVRELITAHGGDVRVANAIDGGAVFTVTLPMAAGNRVEPVLGRMIDPEGLGGPPPRSAGSWARPRKLEG